MQQINAGFIGVGQFINHMHLPHCFANPKYRIHTLCDLNAELLEERRKQYNPLKVTRDYRDLLKDPEIDLVFVGVRHDQHKRFIVEAANAGKHVMVEKPMTLTMEEAEEAAMAVQKNHVKLCVGYNRRFAPAMIAAKALFKKIRGSAANIYYRIATDDLIDPTYYAFDLKKGGGHLVSEGCHILDLLCWFVDSEPIRIYAQGSLESDDNVTLTFTDGAVATMILSRQGGLCYPKEAMEVFTGRNTMCVDQFTEIRTDLLNGGFVQTLFPCKWDEVPEVPGTLGVDGGIELHYKKSRILREQNLYWKRRLQPDKGHYNELEPYADALLNDQPSPVDEVAGARATYLGVKGLESIRENRPMELKGEEYFLNLRRS